MNTVHERGALALWSSASHWASGGRRWLCLAICIVAVSLIATVARVVPHIGKEGVRSDAQLIEHFFAHEEEFTALAAMLDADNDASDLRLAADSRDIAISVQVGDVRERPAAYYVHVDGRESVSRKDARPHTGRGPGVRLFTRDTPIKGRWLIRREAEVAVMFSPY